MLADYPNKPTRDIAEALGRSERAVYMRATTLDLRKSEAYLSSACSGRITETNKATQFKPGQTPWNAGIKGWKAGGRSALTQFKPGDRRGQAARNYRPIGSEILDKDGILIRKVGEQGRRRDQWRPVHVLVWESENGPVPAGHVVCFKPGRRTNEAERITADALELMTRGERMARNSYHNRYPKELARLIQLRGALNRKINERTKHEKQD